MRRAIIAIVAIAIVFGFYQVRSSKENILHELSGFTMGTMYHIKIVDMPAGISKELFAEEIASLLHNLDKNVMSTFTSESELSLFNQAELNKKIPVSYELAFVVDLGLEISKLTDGAFDVTVGPLVNLWGFGPDAEKRSIPPESEISKLLKNVGYEFLQVERNPPSMLKTADIYIDLSGIAKGYAVDQVAEYFSQLEVENYFIEIGGELKIRGYKAGGKSWVPAMEKPLDTASQVHKIFYAGGEETAVAGSGDYRNYFEKDGVHYSHEIDPRTGRPIEHNLAATYVIDQSAARADALATAFMVMGREAAYELAQSLKLAAWFISKNETEEGFVDSYTEQFSDYLIARDQ